MDASDIKPFLDKLVDWSSVQDSIIGVAIVGSYARNEAKPDSDIDVVILSTAPDNYLYNHSWLKTFGIVESCEVEDWGLVTSLRVHFSDGKEVEFSFTSPIWTRQPVDNGTRRVISDGIKILGDKTGMLANTVNFVNTSRAV